MVKTVAEAVGLSFNRIQFTPDLMPADITGTEVIQEDRSTGQREFRFLQGPIFANVVLADEINRTPPKTQAALLEAMQEHQVTIGGQRHLLPHPFFVLATQNPIEQEGTYPLPEAQLDRFMLQIRVGYPTEEEEFAIVRQTTAGIRHVSQPVINHEEWEKLQSVVARIPVADSVIRYALALVRATRLGTSGEGKQPNSEISKYITWGAGPRASQYLVLGAKARAALHGQLHATIADVQAIARSVLRHRLLTNFAADADGVTSDTLIDALIKATPLPGDASSVSKGLAGFFG
jgi:MoxR-like ATPase